MFCAEVIAAASKKSLKIIFFYQWGTSEQVIPRQHLIYKPLLDHVFKFINNITSKICHEIGMWVLVLKLTNLAFRNPIQSQKNLLCTYIMLVL